MSTEGMAKAYEPAAVESRWYPIWENRGYFNGDADPAREPYTIVIPPPNVTGMLHMGHVLNNTLQDILIRFEKLRGKAVCWVPGTDHAGIATQARVEKMLLEKEGVTRYDLGREKFLERVWEWKAHSGGTIIRQLRTLGCACDWRRERFTLDESLSQAVQEVFIHLHAKGLIYKGTRMINWCPLSRTALSDEEVTYQTENGHFYFIQYPFADGNGSLTVATTRPETLLGDTAVAVSPNDPRYADMIGRKLRLPLTDREIPVIADDWVKPEFGTGAVKVTPAHDPNDYAIGMRHGLPMINIMNDDATLNAAAGEDFVGLDRYEARKAVVERLRELGLLVKVDAYTHEVGYSERGKVPVEPRLSAQWFVKMESLAKPALAAVRDGKIKMYPERWTKVYYHWLENINDWCISRQLWWGHRIPAWYGPDGTIYVGRDEAEIRAKHGLAADLPLRQDEDVLDTWFSSWLWPFSVFEWTGNGADGKPAKPNADLAYFYPTATLATGADIIFFWVARMIMAGLEFMGEVPFKDVYFNSIIRDDLGRKISKSLGNSPDPIDVINTYGADALRYTMIYLAPIGTDIRYADKKCELGRNFANKLWNASRFRQMQGPLSPDWANLDGLDLATLRPDDRWILQRTDAAIRELEGALEKFDFHAYSLGLYEFIWNQFCDWYVESAKSAFYGEDAARKTATLHVFDYCWSIILRLMHPVMPFVTEELYHQLGYVGDDSSIMLTSWPKPAGVEQAGVAALVDEKFDLIRAGRNLRTTYNIPMSRKIPYFIKPTDPAFAAMLAADQASVATLLNADVVTIDPAFEPTGTAPSGVGKHGMIYMPLAGLIDVAEETKRLAKQQEELMRGITGIEKRLGNESFIAKAPPAVIDSERAKLAEMKDKLERLDVLIKELGV